MFNYTRFLLVRVNSSHYTEIYLKGYRDAHPINVLLMFQLSFRQMVEGESENSLNDLFVTQTSKKKLTGRGKGWDCVTLFHQHKTVCTLFHWVGPSISFSHFYSWIDLILSKAPQLLQRERAHCDPLFIQANLWDRFRIPHLPRNGCNNVHFKNAGLFQPTIRSKIVISNKVILSQRLGLSIYLCFKNNNPALAVYKKMTSTSYYSCFWFKLDDLDDNLMIETNCCANICANTDRPLNRAKKQKLWVSVLGCHPDTLLCLCRGPFWDRATNLRTNVVLL